MSIKRSILLVILLALIVNVYISVSNEPDYYSYVFTAPKAGVEEAEKDDSEEKNEDKKTALSETDILIKNLNNAQEEWGESVSGRMIVSIKDGAAIASDRDSSVQTRIMGFWGDSYMLEAPVIASGRLLYKEELESGAAVAVLDEQTAIKLFRTGEPIDRYLKIDDKPFRVVGVIKHSRDVADKEELRISVPLKSLDKGGIQSDIYLINLKIVKGQGVYGKIKSSLEGIQSGGTFYNLSKEKHRSLLPVRWSIGFVAILILNILHKLLTNFSKKQFQKEKAKLEEKYFQNLLPVWIIKAILIFALWFAWIYAIYMVLQFMVEPVYIFPEWVPATLVEWSDISAAFWNNRNEVTNLVEMRTPTLLALRYYHRTLILLCISAVSLLLKPYYNVKEKLER